MAIAVNWKEVQRRFVEDGWEAMQIVAEFQVTRMDLGRRITEEKWRKLREDYLVNQVNTAVDSLGLDTHEVSADELVQLGREITKQLRSVTITDAELRKVRQKAETFRTTAEAMNIAMRLSRDVRGVRLGQPSRVQSHDTLEVTYFTRVVERDENGNEREVAQGG